MLRSVCQGLKKRVREMSRPSSDIASLRGLLAEARHCVILTGAGVSAESGIPTFRGAGGLWRRYPAQQLATPQAFRSTPSLVWEFYHHRREVAASKQPNEGHKAIARLQARFADEGKSVTIITQNIDELHQRAGATNVIELHGSLFKTRCTKCREVRVNRDSPICEALRNKGAPDPQTLSADIPEKDLPRCLSPCNGLLRPHIVWFGENLEKSVLGAAEDALSKCDLCLICGTSSVVYPAAMFGPQLAARGVTVAEFNLEATPSTDQFMYHVAGPCGETLPVVLDP